MSVPFGPKNAWVAVADIAPAELAAALGYPTLEPSDWEAGVDFCYKTVGPKHHGLGVFVTPPIGRWTLCAGWTLIHSQKGFTAALSARLGGREVQFFGTHRVSDAHFLERAIGGVMTRYLSEIDANRQEEGEPTAEEIDCGYKPDIPLVEPYDEDDCWFVDEEFILAVAGAWSVDPSMIGTDVFVDGPGFIGRIVPAPVETEARPKPAPAAPPSPPPAGRLRLIWDSIIRR
jgi:hypothetical protein